MSIEQKNSRANGLNNITDIIYGQMYIIKQTKIRFLKIKLETASFLLETEKKLSYFTIE